MKVMVCHFVSDSPEVMTALIVVLPLIVVVEISLQLHRSLLLGNNQHSMWGCAKHL
jgi:Sec-independent protein secretion pathway component TatC